MTVDAATNANDSVAASAAIVPARETGPDGSPLAAMWLGSWHTWDRAIFEEAVGMARTAVDSGAAAFDVAAYRADAVDTQDSPTDLVLSRALSVAGVRRDEYTLGVKGFVQRGAHRTVTRQVEDTLVRHGTDVADYLVLGHIDDESTFDMTEALTEVRDLVQRGLVVRWAVNEWNTKQLTLGNAVADELGLSRPQFTQMQYGIAHRSKVEAPEFHAFLAETGLSIQASSIFDGGALLGRPAARRRGDDAPAIMSAMDAVRERFAAAAADIGATPAQLSLLYPLANPDCAHVLVGVRTPQQLSELLGAFAVLERHGADAVRAAAADFVFDADRANA